MRSDEKNIEYLQLLDAYGPLLTAHRREVCELYYMCDLSLTEIAEQQGTSKQSVSDTLAKSRALLDGYEQKLRHVALARESDLEISRLLTRVLRALEQLRAAHPDIAGEVEGIISLLHTEGEGVGVLTARGGADEAAAAESKIKQ